MQLAGRNQIFLANMSHEIRTPLNGLFGSLQIIQQNKSDTAMVDKYTQVAMSSYYSVIGIVNDILDMTKVTEGKISLYPEPAHLKDILGGVCSDYAATARQKGIQLDGHMSDAAKQGNRLIDTLRLGQILRNLVSNALKFTDEGKVEIFIDVGKQANQIIITVKDSGAGIPENKLDTIFEAFEQVDASRTTERRGTGLGLPIVKRLVELMSGEVSVSSTLGEGTTFTVTVELPITQEKVKQDIAEQITDVKPARILLAEDVKTNQMIFEVMLRDEPYEIGMADDGEIAVQMALSGNYDVVFMDIMMPNMGGIEALQALKVAGFDRPIIACTANVMKDDVEQYLAAGFDGVIGKPYLRDELRMHIQSAVSSGNDVSSGNAQN
jgi:CheY-like chemotaxis protein